MRLYLVSGGLVHPSQPMGYRATGHSSDYSAQDDDHKVYALEVQTAPMERHVALCGSPEAYGCPHQSAPEKAAHLVLHWLCL